MLGLFQGVRDHFATRRFSRSPLGEALHHHNGQYFHSGLVLSWMKPETKKALSQALLDKLGEIERSADPLDTLRHEIGGYAIAASRLTTLALTEEEKAVMPYSANPYISGQLHHHIIDAVPFDEELKDRRTENPDGDAADLVDFANSRGAVMLYFLNGLNIIRRSMGDSDDDHDWFQPMFEAQLVHEEYTFREQLGLPTLIPGNVDANVYGAFLAFVFDAKITNPLLDWLELLPGNYLAGYNANR